MSPSVPRGWQRLGHRVSHRPSGGELARQSQDRISPWRGAGDTDLGALTSPIHTWNEPEKAQPLQALNLATGTKRGGGSDPQAQDTSLFPMPAPWAGCRGGLGCSAPQNRHSQALGLLSPSPASQDPPAQHPAPGTCWGGHGKGHRTVPGVLAPRATLAGTGQAPAGAGGTGAAVVPPNPPTCPERGWHCRGAPGFIPAPPVPGTPFSAPPWKGQGGVGT